MGGLELLFFIGTKDLGLYFKSNFNLRTLL